MGNQLSSAPAQILPLETYVNDVSGLEYISTLRTTRFLKTALVVEGTERKIAKVFVKQDIQAQALTQKKQAASALLSMLARIHNVAPYVMVEETARAVALVRPFYYSTLYDRLNVRPLLSEMEKKWICYQMLLALAKAHKHNVVHGDLKIDNVMLTSWNWVYITDFANFKPAMLAEDNPGGFSYFYDSSGRRWCSLAPERFYKPQQAGSNEHHIFLEGDLQDKMDVFSAGCVFAELFTDGRPLFDLAQLLAFRKGLYTPTATLSSIRDSDVRTLVESMIRVDAATRPSAVQCIKNTTVFPLYMDALHKFLASFVTSPLSSDQRLAKLQQELPQFLAQFDDDAKLSIRHLLLSFVTSCVRSLSLTRSKLSALELLDLLSHDQDDASKLERVLPFYVFLFKDAEPAVRASAVRYATQLVDSVSTIALGDARTFPEYLFPNIQPLVTDAETMVRVVVAESLATIAHASKRFLEISQLSGAEQEGMVASYDEELAALRETLQEFLSTLLNDTSSDVKRAIMSSRLDYLCVFFGHQEATSLLLSHMLTYMLDREDWRLRAAFYQAIPMVASFIGAQAVEQFFWPLLERHPADSNEHVLAICLTALGKMMRLGLFGQHMIQDLVSGVAPYLGHPSLAIRLATIRFLSITAARLGPVAAMCSLKPQLKLYLANEIDDLEDEALVRAALRLPVSRVAYDHLIKSENMTSLYGVLLQRQLRRSGSMVETQARFAAIEAELTSLELNSHQEEMLLALKDHVIKITKLAARPSPRQTGLESQDDGGGQAALGPLQQLHRKQDLEAMGLPVHFTTKADGGQRTDIDPKLDHMLDNAMLVARDNQTPGGANNQAGGSSQSDHVSDNSSFYSLYTADLESLESYQERKDRVATLQMRLRNARLRAATDSSRRQSGRERSSTTSSAAATSGSKPQGVLLAHFHQHHGIINRLSLSPDDALLASASSDGTARIWNLHRLQDLSGSHAPSFYYQPSQTMQQQDEASSSASTGDDGVRACPVRHAAFCRPSGYTLAVAGPEFGIHVVPVLRGRDTRLTCSSTIGLSPGDQVTDLCGMQQVWACENVLSFVTAKGQFVGHDLRMSRAAWTLSCPAGFGMPQSMLADNDAGTWVAVGTTRGLISLWDVRFLQQTLSWQGVTDAPIHRLAHFPGTAGSQSQPKIMSLSDSSGVYVWDLASGALSTLFRPSPALNPPYSKPSKWSKHPRLSQPRSAYRIFQEGWSQREVEKQTMSVSDAWRRLSPSQRSIFFEKQRAEALSYDKQVRENALSWTTLSQMPSRGLYRCLASPRHSPLVVVSGSDALFHVWDTSNSQDGYIFGVGREGDDIQTSYDVTRSVSSTGHVVIKETVLSTSDKDKEANLFSPGLSLCSGRHRDTVTDMAFASESLMISADREGAIKVWK